MNIKKGFWVLYLLSVLYLVNKAFNWAKFPETMVFVEKWILLSVAFLMLVATYFVYKRFSNSI